MARPVLRLDVQDTSSVDFAGTTLTTADEASLGVKAWPFKYMAVWIDITAEAAAGDTLDIEFQCSEDTTNGIDGNWCDVRAMDGNSSVAADQQMPQVTATGTHVSHLVPIPTSDKGYVRVNLNLGDGSDSFDINKFYWIFRERVED